MSHSDAILAYAPNQTSPSKTVSGSSIIYFAVPFAMLFRNLNRFRHLFSIFYGNIVGLDVGLIKQYQVTCMNGAYLCLPALSSWSIQALNYHSLAVQSGHFLDEK